MPRFRDLTGQKFGRFTAIETAGKTKNGQYKWSCECDCGETVVVQGGNLTSGASRSCGCLQRELTSKRSKTHGLRHHPLYMVHHMIKARCYNKRNKDYKHYGARGIEMCPEWKEDFQTFYDWAMANGYEEGLTVDRVNNDGPYEPSNCQLIGQAAQKRNTRRSRMLTYKGKTQCMAAWAREAGVHPENLLYRLSNGWSVEEALTGVRHRTCRR